MRLFILDEEFFFENTSSAMVQLLEVISAKISDNDLLVSHLNVDGVDVFSDFESYLEENWFDVDRVIVHTTNSNNLVTELMISIEEYTKRAVPEIRNLSEQFYQGATNDTWIVFGQLLEGLQWFQQTSLFMQKQELHQDLIEFAQTHLDFSEVIRSLEEAVENQDVVLIGDIILYEILPQFERVSNKSIEIVSNEVLIDAAN